MNKKSIRKGVSRLLAIGLVLAYMCMATACTNNDKNGNNSGSMAGNGATTENGTANGNGTNDNVTNGTTNNNNTAPTTPAKEPTTPAETMDNTNNMNGTVNGGSVLDDAGNAVGDVVEDAANGVSDITNDLIGDNDNNRNTSSTTTP